MSSAKRVAARAAEQRWRSKNKERWVAGIKRWQNANQERLRQLRLAHYAANRDTILRGWPCPLCGAGISQRVAVCCDCLSLMRAIEKRGGIAKRTIAKYIENLTEGDREKWRNVIAQRKAHKSHKGSLKTLASLMAAKSGQSSK